MLSNTLKDYKENYEGRLSAHKKEYFENDKTSFLELELSNYTKYYNSLKKVIHFTKTSPRNNLGQYPITSVVGWELEIINKPVFNEIISEKKADPEHDEDKFRRLLYPGKNAPSIEINIKVLNNRITSTKRILDFIGKQLTISQGITEQQPEVPDDRLVVSEEVIPKKYPEKWHALQYLLELKANDLKPPLSTEGTFIRKDLEAIGSSRTGKSGQMFYRSVLNHYKDLDKPEILEKSFGKDWKETIIILSNGDNTLKDYLDKHY